MRVSENWKVIFKEKDHIEEKLKEISNILVQPDIFNCGYGLFSGYQGVIMFLFYYYLFTKDIRYRKIANKLILDSIRMAKNKPSLALSNGHLGVLWTLNFLDSLSLIECDITEIFNEKLIRLNDEMKAAFKLYGYDFLHGGIGYLFFYSELKKRDCYFNCISEGIDWIEKNSILDERINSLKWELSDKNVKQFNLGLSHGIPSIIRVLTKLFQINRDPRVELLIIKAINFVIYCKQDYLKFGSFFPTYVNQNSLNGKSRLAWCYGDLGICIAIWYAADALGKDDLKEVALNILNVNAGRRNIIDENVIDSGICHGAAGIMHIFNRFYQMTNNELYLDASIYWLNALLSQAKYTDGLAGYKAYFNDKHGKWVNQVGLLEGIAGIGLGLLSVITPIEPKWDRCLLIS